MFLTLAILPLTNPPELKPTYINFINFLNEQNSGTSTTTHIDIIPRLEKKKLTRVFFFKPQM